MPVYHDVDHIQPLTKSELITFYDDFIAPSSNTRAKIAVHLVAQSTPAALTQEAKVQAVVGTLVKFFTAQGIPANMEQLVVRLKDVDVNSTNPAMLINPIMEYLILDADIPDAQAKVIVEQGIAIMNAATAKSITEAPTESLTTSKPPIRIEDVRTYKAGLQLSAGPHPARSLTEFEDTEAKL